MCRVLVHIILNHVSEGSLETEPNFYGACRTIVAGAAPNAAHYAVAALQRRCQRQDKNFVLLTQVLHLTS